VAIRTTLRAVDDSKEFHALQFDKATKNVKKCLFITTSKHDDQREIEEADNCSPSAFRNLAVDSVN
jgi:hypothetical protein